MAAEDKLRDLLRRRAALKIVDELPEDKGTALAVLEYVRKLIHWQHGEPI